MDQPSSQFVPAGRFLEVDGKRVHAHVYGDGPDVILIHGASVNAQDFTFGFVDRLVAAGFRVTAFDRPGMGRSEALHRDGESMAEQAAHLDRAAEALGIERAVVVGHSFGGGVAMAWGLSRSPRVAAIVTLAGIVMPWPETMDAFRRLASREEDGAALVSVIAVVNSRAFTHSTLEAIFTPQPVPPGYGDHLLLPPEFRRPSFRANSRQVSKLAPQVAEMAKLYAGLDLPVEILHGSHDAVGSVMVHARQMARRLPQGRLTELEGIGHMPHHVAPDPVVATIIRAVARAGLR
ncbi:alpha/beta hydrolase [Tropicimonas sp. TH_r6]|uniref:alpha/beta fold hydrolase n=1 Tax=Tropicimonas sp. TH_r6 TaxID=3082085 RepID=UPI0029545AB1|nr:alpha/beta hydrolase [Tropicimonas sp. TH_r6]MDV7142453.1 alpha/beta hydrolase [Tropicimonas sp. TH_r6]